jgi:hypothetical protein
MQRAGFGQESIAWRPVRLAPCTRLVLHDRACRLVTICSTPHRPFTSTRMQAERKIVSTAQEFKNRSEAQPCG